MHYKAQTEDRKHNKRTNQDTGSHNWDEHIKNATILSPITEQFSNTYTDSLTSFISLYVASIITREP